MTYVYITIGILVLGFIVLMVISGKLVSQMEERSKSAINDAKENHKTNLDLTVESIKKVNEIIQNLHDTKPSDIKGTSMLYGSYIGEVIRTVDSKGFWVKDVPGMGKDLYPIKFSNDNYAFPVVWVEKHLNSGEEENILHKFNTWKYAHELAQQAK